MFSQFLGGFLCVILCFDFLTLLNNRPILNSINQSMSLPMDKNCLLENAGVVSVFAVLLYKTDGLNHKFGFLSSVTQISERVSSLFNAT